ncbi:contactin-associated protein like 5-3-like [Asterias rubens]|uniref:contactin-associated protein like 5-3-like n=1 Tax=Asterias rubens TaxID=7604 RepID=UPI00145542C5|nr:contactin-associated protein like 5-3-like [Asterias rubens]
MTEVDSDPYDVNIAYSVPMDQITSLIGQSTRCRQNLVAECKNAKIWNGDNQLAWWVSRDGARMMNWGGSKNFEGCLCSVDNDCELGHRCNCGARPDVWKTDGGFLTDKTKLPVSALHFGSAAPPKEMRYKLQSLQCYTGP